VGVSVSKIKTMGREWFAEVMGERKRPHIVEIYGEEKIVATQVRINSRV
jgi:hypothetical protein